SLRSGARLRRTVTSPSRRSRSDSGTFTAPWMWPSGPANSSGSRRSRMPTPGTSRISVKAMSGEIRRNAVPARTRSMNELQPDATSATRINPARARRRRRSVAFRRNSGIQLVIGRKDIGQLRHLEQLANALGGAHEHQPAAALLEPRQVADQLPDPGRVDVVDAVQV